VAQQSESQKLVEARTIELQNLSARLLQLQDEERRRISRELHDSVGQELAAVKMAIGSVRDKDKAIEALKKAAEMVDSAIKSVRTMSYLLHPPLLDEVGLLAAIHWFVDGLQKRSGLQVQLIVKPATLARFSRDIEATIYRVLQEALTNVYRHSESRAARVEIDQQPRQVVLRVRDYGRGFFSQVVTEGPVRFGVGMSGMRERVKQFGGEFKVSPAEPGTLIEAVIPLFAG